MCRGIRRLSDHLLRSLIAAAWRGLARRPVQTQIAWGRAGLGGGRRWRIGYRSEMDTSRRKQF